MDLLYTIRLKLIFLIGCINCYKGHHRPLMQAWFSHCLLKADLKLLQICMGDCLEQILVFIWVWNILEGFYRVHTGPSLNHPLRVEPTLPVKKHFRIIAENKSDGQTIFHHYISHSASFKSSSARLNIGDEGWYPKLISQCCWWWNAFLPIFNTFFLGKERKHRY